MSQSSEEVVTPLASQDTQNEVKEQEDVTKKEEKRQVSDKESQQQPVGYSTETKDVYRPDRFHSSGVSDFDDIPF